MNSCLYKKVLCATISPMLIASLLTSCSIQSDELQANSELKQQVEGSSLNSKSNEELISLLEQIRNAKQESNNESNGSLDILETEVQFEFEKRYQDIYNKELINSTNKEDFIQWKKRWKEQLEKEQAKNKLFSDYFYNTFVEQLDKS